MKKIIYLLSLIIFFGSCSSNLSIVKRKYNAGFYVSKSQGVDKKQTSTQTTIVTEIFEESKSEENTLEASVQPENEISITSQAPEIKKVAIKHSENITKQESLFENKIKAPLKKVTKGVLGVMSEQSGMNKSGRNDRILWVILCFLWWLNLIAVFLHDGKAITLNFWVTLLLNFTLIGGIIFSLLVVLGVVDLA